MRVLAELLRHGLHEPVLDRPHRRIARRVAEKRDKLATTAKRVAELTFELTGIGPLNARRGGVETERQRLITEANALQIDIEADQKALSNVEEEGRRAGALPGWLRD